MISCNIICLWEEENYGKINIKLEKFHFSVFRFKKFFFEYFCWFEKKIFGTIFKKRIEPIVKENVWDVRKHVHVFNRVVYQVTKEVVFAGIYVGIVEKVKE